MLLKNKVIVVIGAAGFLGREILDSLIKEGAKVIAADLIKEQLNLIESRYKNKALKIKVIDITKKDSVISTLQYCIKVFGKIDGAVNAAYPRNNSYGNEVFDVTYDDFKENVGLHLGGYFVFMQQCADYIRKENHSFSLVNISSIYGSIAPKFEIYDNTDMTMPVEYAAIKAGLIHLNRYFSKYMKGTKFRVNSVSPGGILDNQDNIFLDKYNTNCLSKGMLEPKDLTGIIIFLLSDRSEYLKAQNIIVDDGFSIWPKKIGFIKK